MTIALGQVERAVGSADVAPTPDATAAFERDHEAAQKALADWNDLKSNDLTPLNSALKQAGLPPISLEEGKTRSALTGEPFALDDE